MTQLDEQGATTLRKRSVRRTRRVLDVSAGAVVSRLVAQSSLKHQNFFAQGVCVQVKLGASVIANNGSRPSHFAAISG
jgi:hypothetical protein